MRFLFFFTIFIISNNYYSQTPTISYQNVTGGLSADRGVSMVELSNGNYVICASSWSDISGDKTEDAYGKTDYWVYETQSNGTLVWQITVGGSEYDNPVSMIQTSDGGFMVIGNSDSPISGNKTSVHYGGYDIWVVKISSSGILEWQKSYGGQDGDFGMNLLELSPNKIVLATTSSSGVNGNKSVASKGMNDFWTIYVDSQGAIDTQYVYGGSSDEYVRGISILNESIIFTGRSSSNISGDKLENSYGSSDYWVIITDTNGTILRSNTYGGNDYESNPAVSINPNGTFSLFGSSRSPASGSKTSANFGLDDYWVVNIDSNLNLLWDVSFGGDNQEDGVKSGMYFSVLNNMNIILGDSKSNASGNKTLDSFGEEDFWAVGMDTNGVKMFEFVAGGTSKEQNSRILESSKGTLFVLGSSFSDISGNKTESSKGSTDVWLLELDFNLSIRNIVKNNQLDVFPIPSSSILNFSIPVKGVKSKIILTSLDGKVVCSSMNLFGEDESLDISHLDNGIYVLSVICEEFQYTRKIIVN